MLSQDGSRPARDAGGAEVSRATENRQAVLPGTHHHRHNRPWDGSPCWS